MKVNRSIMVHLVCFITLIATGLSVTPLLAQERPRIISPEVQADRRVVFRLWAPLASDVQLSGDWMGRQPPVKLAKSDDGVWSATLGPLAPNIYTYGFLVDGVRASDPSCRCTITWAGRAASSRFVVPAESPKVWDNQNQAPGTLHHERFYSKLQQRLRRFVVYTPPGYELSGSRPYPTLILLPGTPGDENDWTSGGGFAEVMFDNLIAQNKMVPMIVVMHASDVLENGKRDDNLRQFEPLLIDELLPVVRKRYRVSSQPRLWAIAGLSLGGEFAMAVGLRHPELFRTVASLSGSLVPSSFANRFGQALAQAKAVSRDYRLVWVGCGSEDIFFDGAKAFAGQLQAAGIPHIFRQYNGAHVMPVFRQELAELLPLLFRT
jgi:enterochelin esterase-like enzyme